MQFQSKIKKLEKAGLGSLMKTHNVESETLIIQSLKGLIKTNYERLNSNPIKVMVYTEKELIERETETIVSCYFNELINQMKKPDWVDSKMVDLLVGSDDEQYAKARKFVKGQLETNDKVILNNLVQVEGDYLIAGKFYLYIV